MCAARVCKCGNGIFESLRGLLKRLAGTPEQVADTIEDWLRNGAADGFNVMPPVISQQFEWFTSEVVPLLRKRGLFRSEYDSHTLARISGWDRCNGHRKRGRPWPINHVWRLCSTDDGGQLRRSMPRKGPHHGTNGPGPARALELSSANTQSKYFSASDQGAPSFQSVRNARLTSTTWGLV